jgi:hypothetical protein
MFDIWTNVKVTNPDHPRFGTAGNVQAINKEKPDSVGVKFDADGVLEVVAKADLQAL